VRISHEFFRKTLFFRSPQEKSFSKIFRFTLVLLFPKAPEAFPRRHFRKFALFRKDDTKSIAAFSMRRRQHFRKHRMEHENEGSHEKVFASESCRNGWFGVRA
jgi:hypothetical protein